MQQMRMGVDQAGENRGAALVYYSRSARCRGAEIIRRADPLNSTAIDEDGFRHAVCGVKGVDFVADDQYWPSRLGHVVLVSTTVQARSRSFRSLTLVPVAPVMIASSRRGRAGVTSCRRKAPAMSTPSRPARSTVVSSQRAPATSVGPSVPSLSAPKSTAGRPAGR